MANKQQEQRDLLDLWFESQEISCHNYVEHHLTYRFLHEDVRLVMMLSASELSKKVPIAPHLRQDHQISSVSFVEGNR